MKDKNHKRMRRTRHQQQPEIAIINKMKWKKSALANKRDYITTTSHTLKIYKKNKYKIKIHHRQQIYNIHIMCRYEREHQQ